MEPKGILLYAEDLDILDRMLTPAEAFAIVMALNRYAMDGEIPEGLSAAQMIAFEMMRQKIDRAMQNYAAKSEKRSAAARQRWSTGASDTMQTDAKDANASDAKQTMQKHGTENVSVNETVTEKETEAEGVVIPPREAPVLGIDGSDLTQAMKDNDEAQRMVAKYMPASRSPLGFDPRVGAISDMIGEFGKDKVEAAFKEAVASDNRGGVSVAFVKAIVTGTGKARAAPKGDYQKREYTKDQYAGMYTDLSAELEALKTG